ncbi:MAG: autotransporter adhesin family protein [Candidatus Bathyarchaeota archaeon]|nr:autotransporter adhesin family protein [Candidatus Termiticorpusculum sp.]
MMNGKMKRVNMDVKYRFSLQNICTKTALIFVSLLMVAIVFSPLVLVFSGGVSFFVSGAETPDVVAKNATELENAISVAPDGVAYVIGLGNDVKLESSLEIPSTKNITLVSVGGVWKLVGANKQDTINVNGLLRIDGITVTHVDGDSGRGVYVKNGGMLTLIGGEISGNTVNDDGGGVYNKGVFVMLDGKISNNVVDKGKISDKVTEQGDGGGVYNIGTFTMSGGEISGNTAAFGGGVYNYGSVFVMSGGKITGNTATFGGGGVYNDTSYYIGGSFTMSGGEIIGNTANGVGGGVFYVIVNAVSNFHRLGGVISGNTDRDNEYTKDVGSVTSLPDSGGDGSGGGKPSIGVDVGSGLAEESSSTDGDQLDTDDEQHDTGGNPHDFLLIVVAVIVVGLVVAGLLFYHSKKQEQPTTKNSTDSAVV